MPNVPKLPGVPTLTSYAGSAPVLAVADAIIVANALLTPHWGLFLNGQQILPTPTSFFGTPSSFAAAGINVPSLQIPSILGPLGNTNTAAVDFKREWAISDYPQEDGAFQSYDKVQIPKEVRLRFSAGGSLTNRKALLDAVDSAATSLNLYKALTPDAQYDSLNITHYDYHREARGGVGLLIVDVWLIQVVVTAKPAFSSTATPAGSSSTNGGSVQTQTPASANIPALPPSALQ